MEPQYIKVETQRMGDPTLSLIAARLETLHEDVTDMKTGMKDLAAAITKLAVVEERISGMMDGQSRAFKKIEGLREDVKAVSGRVDSLEQAAPLQKKTSDWILAAVWAAAGTAAATVLHKLGIL